MNDNVIKFPKNNPRITEEITEHDVQNSSEMMRLFHIQETINNLMPLILNQLAVSGFDISDEEVDIKDGAFIIESLRSVMCKHYGIYHPFQKILEEVFIPFPDEPGALKIVDRICVDLKKESEGD